MGGWRGVGGGGGGKGGGGRGGCGRSKETVIIFHVTEEIWGLSGWLMAESPLRWNQEKVSVGWCHSFFWWTLPLMDRRIWLWLAATLASTHPPVPALCWSGANKHTWSRCACQPRSLHLLWHRRQGSAQSEVVRRKTPGTHSTSGFQETALEPLGCSHSHYAKWMIVASKYSLMRSMFMIIMLVQKY